MTRALYWHPFLAEGLRLSYAGRLDVQDNLHLGELPLQTDLLVRRDPTLNLPYPLGFLGATTLIELKSPSDLADQSALEQLVIYALLYVRREGLARRADLTLWLLASSFALNMSQPGRTELRGVRRVGPGMAQGTVDGFPIVVLDLCELPFTPDTIALHMVSGPPRNYEMVEYLVTHRQQYPRQLEQLAHLHLLALAEVLMTHNLTPEQLGWTPEAAAKFLALFKSGRPYKDLDTDVLVEELLQRPGKEAALLERLVRRPERQDDLIDKLVQELGVEEIRRRIEARSKPATALNNATPPAQASEP